MISNDNSLGKAGGQIWLFVFYAFFALVMSIFLGLSSAEYSYDGAGTYMYEFTSIGAFLCSMYLFYCIFQAGRTARVIEVAGDKANITDFLGRVSTFSKSEIEAIKNINMDVISRKMWFLYADNDKRYREMTNSKICFKNGSWYFITPKMSGLDEIKESLGLD